VNGFQGRFPPTFSSTRIFEQSFDGFRECIHVAVGIQQTVDAGRSDSISGLCDGMLSLVTTGKP
jgi:hypothetical protein